MAKRIKKKIMAYKMNRNNSPVRSECEIDAESSDFGVKPPPGTKRYSRWAFRQGKKRRKSCNAKRTKSHLFGL